MANTLNEAVDGISMHSVRIELLIKQAESIGIPLYKLRLPEMPDMTEYDEAMRTYLTNFNTKGITHSIFGDICLEHLKDIQRTVIAKFANVL